MASLTEALAASGILQLTSNAAEFIPPGNRQFCGHIKVISIPQNELRELPVWVHQFEMLRELHVENNVLQDLPHFLRRQTNLTLLNLSGNKLNTQRNSLHLYSLKDLDLSFNHLYRLPAEVYLLTNLVKLTIDHNLLRTLEPGIGALVGLREFTATHNQLAGLPRELCNCVNIKHIDVSDNPTLRSPPYHLAKSMTAIVVFLMNLNYADKTGVLMLRDLELTLVPGTETNLFNLVTLDLRGNKITEMSHWVPMLTSLIELYVDANRLQLFPQENIAPLHRLQLLSLSLNYLEYLELPCTSYSVLTALNIANNRLEEFPDSIRRLSALQSLFVHKNPMKLCPWWIGELPDLDGNRLQVDFERVRNIPKEIRRIASNATYLAFCRQSFLYQEGLTDKFVINGFALTTVPLEIFQMDKIVLLDLSGNQLNHVPDAIENLQQLTTLDFRHNQLRTIPENTCKIKSLRNMWVSYNKMDFLPSNTRFLSNLEDLQCQSNQIGVLGDYFTNLVRLKSLSLGDNPLVDFPSWISKCTRLERVGISRSGIKHFPQELIALTNVTELELSDNVLEELPSELGQIQTLEIVHLDGNKIEELPFRMLSTITFKEFTFSRNPLGRMDTGTADWTQERLLRYLRNLDKGTETSECDLSDLGLQTMPVQLMYLPIDYKEQGLLTVLNLDNNNIVSIPSSISIHTRLHTLMLRNNPLVFLPPSLPTVTCLTNLVIDGEQLATSCIRPPPFVCAEGSELMLRYLGELFIGAKVGYVTLIGMKMLGIPADLLDACGIHLRKLIVSDNRISDIPAWGHLLTELTELDISDNWLVSPLHPSFVAMVSLTTVDMSDNRIRDLPEEIFELTALTSLKCSGNKLTELPDTFARLTRLEVLHMARCDFMVYPQLVVTLSQLVQLEFSHNPLEVLPLELAWLPELVDMPLVGMGIVSPPQAVIANGTHAIKYYLNQIWEAGQLCKADLRSIQITAFPPELATLPQLTTLNLSKNEMCTIPAIIAALTNLTILDLSHNKLHSLPDELGQLKLLQTVHFDHNCFTLLTRMKPRPVVWQLNHLETLTCSWNQLTNAPNGIEFSPKLRVLDFDHNCIHNFPVAVGQLSHVTELGLAFNGCDGYAMYRMGMGNLDSLRELRVGGNKLMQIPPSLGNLSGLTRLKMESNLLPGVTPDFRKLCNVEYLDISYNKFLFLPLQFRTLTALKTIVLDGNELRDPPRDVIEAGAQSIVAYLQKESQAQQNTGLAN